MKVSILGAGIGGLTTAILLKQNHFDVELYERDELPRTMGAGIVLWPNAIKALDAVGLLEKLSLPSFTLSTMRIYDSGGEELRQINLERLSNYMDHYSAYPILRKDLHLQLTQLALDLGIIIHYKHRVTAVHDQGSQAACVTFDNDKTITADLLIGSDGRMNSMARKYVAGHNTPIYQNYVNWVGVLPEFNHEERLMPIIKDYWGVGERFGLVPLSQHSAYWAGCKRLAAGLGKPDDDDKQTLLDMFEQWPKLITDVIYQTPHEAIQRIEVYDLEPIETWYRKNVVLLGDSAHAAGPTSGQGACQAIEDAVCLTTLLSQSGDLEEALLNYQHIRSPKTKDIILNARDRVERIFESDEEKCLKRNKQARLLLEEDAIQGMVSLWQTDLKTI